MRKILLIFLVSSLVLILNGCLDDNEFPLIIGDRIVTYKVFSEEPDWASLVTVTDDEDGSAIIESLTIDSIDVNMNFVGDYVVSYTVIDSNSLTTIFEINVEIIDSVAPTFEIQDQIIFTSTDNIDWTRFITNIEDNYYTEFNLVEVDDNIDYGTLGEYEVTVKVIDDSFNETSKTITVEVLEYVYANGFYNYKFIDTELRNTFMAAAEKYLMNNMYAGVPLFASGSFVMYSSRLLLPVDKYISVMNYGADFGTMSADDSTVIMYDGLPGNTDDYTYRTTISSNPNTFNQWLYDTSNDLTLMNYYYDSLYTYELNDEKNGYDVNPSMAISNPVALNSTYNEYAVEVAKVWEISLKDDLVWKYHPDTDISNLPNGHDEIKANDFVDTFRLALDGGWFRAISGGGDFISSTYAIKGVQDYLDGIGSWEDVGLKVVGDDNLTIQFEFIGDMSEWNVKYWLSSEVMTPINIDLYNEFEDNLVGNDYNLYGTSNTTIAYTGPFYVDEYVEDMYINMKENDQFHSPDKYFYTGYNFSIVQDPANIFQMFIDNKLESTSVPTVNVDSYHDDPRTKHVPGATTYRMMINGLGTEEAQREKFPDGTWIPEPLLANQEFKMAMFHAIDRLTLTQDILKIRTPSMYLFSTSYLVDAELGIPYRYTEQGISVGEGLYPETYGFNFDVAHTLYLSAIEDLIASGDYEAGTSENPTEIIIELNSYSGSESWDLTCAYIKTVFENTFKDDVNHINVIIEIYTKDFPGIYYDYMMVGEFDLSMGGISGSTLCAPSFLDVYCSDNRGGFTLNWGIDTSVAEIIVEYYDSEGIFRSELWSFDAIASVLNGLVYIINGEEADFPTEKMIN